MKRFIYFIQFGFFVLISSCVESSGLASYCADVDVSLTNRNKVSLSSGSLFFPSNFDLVVDGSSVNTVYNSNLQGQVGSIIIMPIEKCSLCTSQLDSSNPVVSFYQALYELAHINIGELKVTRMKLKIKNEAMINVVAFVYDDKNALHINNSDENLWCDVVSSWKPSSNRLKNIRDKIEAEVRMNLLNKTDS